MWSITLNGKLHLAPIGPDIANALDIGTGTGIWAIEFGIYCTSAYFYRQLLIFSADAYPSAKVIGTDLSPIGPA
jgi:methylase of polypeptide subunit release factors